MSNPPISPYSHLATRMAGVETSAWEEYYKYKVPRIIAALRRRNIPLKDAEDLVQVKSLRFFETRASYVPGTGRRIAPVIMRWCINKFIDDCRERNRNPVVGAISFDPTSPPASVAAHLAVAPISPGNSPTAPNAAFSAEPQIQPAFPTHEEQVQWLRAQAEAIAHPGKKEAYLHKVDLFDQAYGPARVPQKVLAEKDEVSEVVMSQRIKTVKDKLAEWDRMQQQRKSTGGAHA